MLEIILDSVILIDHFNNQKKATRFVSNLDPNETAISVITRAEILVGFDDDVNNVKISCQCVLVFMKYGEKINQINLKNIMKSLDTIFHTFITWIQLKQDCFHYCILA